MCKYISPPPKRQRTNSPSRKGESVMNILPWILTNYPLHLTEECFSLVSYLRVIPFRINKKVTPLKQKVIIIKEKSFRHRIKIRILQLQIYIRNLQF